MTIDNESLELQLEYSEKVARLYSLYVVEPEMKIGIAFHQGLLEQCNTLFRSAGMQKMAAVYEIEEIHPDIDSDYFAFGKTFQRVDDDGEWIRLEAQIPSAEYLSHACAICEGEGCNYCSNTGRESSIGHRQLGAISLSLGELCRYFAYQDTYRSESSLQQSFSVWPVWRKDLGIHAAPITGIMGAQTLQWCKEVTDEDLEKITNTKINCYAHITNQKHYDEMDRWSFRMMVNDHGALMSDCPGNACGINPTFIDSVGETSGYRYSSHNMDTLIQQMTILIGLAKMQELIDKKTAS